MSGTARKEIKGTRADFYVAKDITNPRLFVYLGSVLTNGFPEIQNGGASDGVGVARSILELKTASEFVSAVDEIIDTINWPHEHETSYYSNYAYIFNEEESAVHCFKKGEWFSLSEYYQDREICFPIMKEVW